MKTKVLNIILIMLLLVSMLVILTGCGENDSTKSSDEENQSTQTEKENTISIIEGEKINYSNLIENSENIGKVVEYQPEVDEGFNVSEYEGILFPGNEDYPGNLETSTEVEEDIEWVVLAEDDTNVLITSSKPVNARIAIDGPDGYNNGVQALHAYCAKYYSATINGKKYTARSLNLDDIEALYKDKTDSWKQSTDSNYELDASKFFDFDYNKNYNKSGMLAKFYSSYPALYALEQGSNMGGNLGLSDTPNGYEPYNNGSKEDATSTENYVNTYYLASRAQLTENINSKSAEILLNTDDKDCWVASRSFSIAEDSTTGSFGIRIISDKGDLGFIDFTSTDGGWWPLACHIRPVVVIPKAELGL